MGLVISLAGGSLMYRELYCSHLRAATRTACITIVSLHFMPRYKNAIILMHVR